MNKKSTMSTERQTPSENWRATAQEHFKKNYNKLWLVGRKTNMRGASRLLDML